MFNSPLLLNEPTCFYANEFPCIGYVQGLGFINQGNIDGWRYFTCDAGPASQFYLVLNFYCTPAPPRSKLPLCQIGFFPHRPTFPIATMHLHEDFSFISLGSPVGRWWPAKNKRKDCGATVDCFQILVDQLVSGVHCDKARGEWERITLFQEMTKCLERDRRQGAAIKGDIFAATKGDQIWNSCRKTIQRWLWEIFFFMIIGDTSKTLNYVSVCAFWAKMSEKNSSMLVCSYNCVRRRT